MKRLYLITHAHTAQQPDVDATLWRLSERGIEQSILLAQRTFWADVDQIVVSGEAKTRLTAAPAAVCWQLPLVYDHGFSELQRVGWGTDYEGQVRDVFARPHASIGGWEPAHAALRRFVAGVAALPPMKAGRSVALVSHGLILSLYRAFLLGRPVVDFAEWQQLSFAAVASVDLTNGSLERDFSAVAGESPRRGG